MARRKQTAAAVPADKPSLRFTPINLVLLATALAVIALGYVMLSNGSNVAAPLLLVLGYAVLLPAAIIL